MPERGIRQLAAVAAIVIVTIPTLNAQRRGPRGERTEGPNQVSWSATEVVDEVAAGKTKEIRLKFRPASDLDEVEIWLTPSLSKAVTPQPRKFSTLKGGQEYELTLIVSMPEAPPQEAFNGTIHLRHAKQTLRSPLQVQIGVGSR